MAKIIQKSTGALLYHFQDQEGNYAQADSIDLKIYDPDGILIKEYPSPNYVGSGVYQYVMDTTLTVKAGRYEAHWHTIKDQAEMTDIEYFDVVKSEGEYLVSLADVQEFTGITGQDSLMRQLIFAFQGFAEKYCQIKFKPIGIVDERHNGDNTRTLYLKGWPMLDISKVEVKDYYVIPERSLNEGITQGFIADFDTSLIELTSDYIFIAGQGNVLVTYIYGYDEIPADLKMVTLEWISLKLKNKDSLGLKSEGLGPYSKTYDASYIPENIRSILDQYRRGFGV
ncbi:hypothetical protein KKG63_03570 [Patescibacteria group bacterium]|nr:hypothetical protein [Patescibacteria group bacterium]MBU1999463.1 hypothetical protein [Candidatus Omnitrophota bacterium]